MTEQHIGGYRVVRQIGQGGMGAVYEAVDGTTGQIVALKVLQQRFTRDSDLVKRFLNEARAADAIRHRGIVRVYASGQLTDGTCYIAMERLPGESLSARIKRSGGRVGISGVPLIQQAAAALAAAHEKRIYHRDLKPSNLMLVPDPTLPGGEGVKIIDFGIAKLPIEEQGGGAEFHTRTGAMIGTPVYMSPEQCRGVAVTDRTDVYSLGVLLFHVLCGRPPFFSAADGDVLAMHILVPPPAVRSLALDVPAELAELIERMLTKAPLDRPSMADVAAALSRVAAAFAAGAYGPQRAPDGPSGRAAPTVLQQALPADVGDERTALRKLSAADPATPAALPHLPGEDELTALHLPAEHRHEDPLAPPTLTPHSLPGSAVVQQLPGSAITPRLGGSAALLLEPGTSGDGRGPAAAGPQQSAEGRAASAQTPVSRRRAGSHRRAVAALSALAVVILAISGAIAVRRLSRQHSPAPAAAKGADYSGMATIQKRGEPAPRQTDTRAEVQRGPQDPLSPPATVTPMGDEQASGGSAGNGGTNRARPTRPGQRRALRDGGRRQAEPAVPDFRKL